MNILLLLLVTLAILFLLFSFFFLRKKKVVPIERIPASFLKILNKDVPFYQELNADKKKEFEERLQLFLTQIKITGVNTKVEDIDKVFIAASALIPIFNFQGWEYVTLHEVLLYPDSFNHDFDQSGANRSVLGMVGNGPLNHIMILSQHQLRQAFINKTGKDNTTIHEFVHLVDKTDGAIDGIPDFILDKQYIVPWVQLMHKEIKLIKENKSDIDPYGATNESEFFAVVSEYFFERPALLEAKHPDLFALLTKIFRKNSTDL